MPRTHFSADHHFGHLGIIPACNRPWTDVQSMNRDLVEMWNAVVAPADTIYYLGDFAHKCDAREARAIFDRLNGIKHLSAAGNHDNEYTRAMPWASIGDITEVVVEGERLVLCHYAMRAWNGQNRGALMLYGHAHGRLAATSASCDVGVDTWSYMPTNIAQIRQHIVNQPDPERENDLELEIDIKP